MIRNIVVLCDSVAISTFFSSPSEHPRRNFFFVLLVCRPQHNIIVVDSTRLAGDVLERVDAHCRLSVTPINKHVKVQPAKKLNIHPRSRTRE